MMRLIVLATFIAMAVGQFSNMNWNNDRDWNPNMDYGLWNWNMMHNQQQFQGPQQQLQHVQFPQQQPQHVQVPQIQPRQVQVPQQKEQTE